VILSSVAAYPSLERQVPFVTFHFDVDDGFRVDFACIRPKNIMFGDGACAGLIHTKRYQPAEGFALDGCKLNTSAV
jgi:hypothetical protein